MMKVQINTTGTVRIEVTDAEARLIDRTPFGLRTNEQRQQWALNVVRAMGLTPAVGVVLDRPVIFLSRSLSNKGFRALVWVKEVN
jgi:hypothetical protein